MSEIKVNLPKTKLAMKANLPNKLGRNKTL